MALSDTIREIFSPEPLRGELTPVGLLDRLAGVGLVAAGVLYIFSITFGGIIRGVLGTAGLAPVIYAPPMVAIAALAANTLVRIGDPRTSVATLVIVGFVAVEAVIALFLGRQAGAVVFQLYIFLAAFVMMALTQRHMQERVIRVMVPMFFVAAVGVYLNVFIDFPWADATYEVMGVQQNAAREWSAGGHARLAGFSRASTAVASQILIGYCAVEHKTRSLLWRGIWWVVGLGAVHFSTSKAPMLAMTLLPITYFLIGRIRGTGEARRGLLAAVLMGFWVLLIFIGPLLSITYGRQMFPQGPGVGASYDSLADRVLTTWPNAIGLVDWSNPISWLVGRGLGGIGGAQVIFEPARYNPADNLAIYLFVILGLGSIGVACLIFRGGARSIMSGSRGRRDFAMVIAMLGVGTAANVIEATLPMMVLGMTVVRGRRRTAPGSGDGQARRRSGNRRRAAAPMRQSTLSS